MWTTPEKHTNKRETLRNANQNKTTRRAGYKKVYAPPPPKDGRHYLKGILCSTDLWRGRGSEEFTLPHLLQDTGGIFVKQVVFHTVNHRGPFPLKELHSTGETIVWRDPGGS